MSVDTVKKSSRRRLPVPRPRWILLAVVLVLFAAILLMYLVLIQSVLAALGGVRLGWQKLRRTGRLGALIGAKLPTARQ